MRLELLARREHVERTGEGLGATVVLRNDAPGDVLRVEATAADV